MKKIIFLLLSLFTNLAYAQTLDSLNLDNYYQNVIYSKPYFDFQNWMDENRTLPEGIYYQFEGKIIYEDGKKFVEHFPIHNQERIFGFLLALDIPLKEAWYRQQESNCRIYTVGVNSSLLIKLERRISDELMERLGFSYTNIPSVGECPYNVLHYTFE